MFQNDCKRCGVFRKILKKQLKEHKNTLKRVINGKTDITLNYAKGLIRSSELAVEAIKKTNAAIQTEGKNQ